MDCGVPLPAVPLCDLSAYRYDGLGSVFRFPARPVGLADATALAPGFDAMFEGWATVPATAESGEHVAMRLTSSGGEVLLATGLDPADTPPAPDVAEAVHVDIATEVGASYEHTRVLVRRSSDDALLFEALRFPRGEVPYPDLDLEVAHIRIDEHCQGPMDLDCGRHEVARSITVDGNRKVVPLETRDVSIAAGTFRLYHAGAATTVRYGSAPDCSTSCADPRRVFVAYAFTRLP